MYKTKTKGRFQANRSQSRKRPMKQKGMIDIRQLIHNQSVVKPVKAFESKKSFSDFAFDAVLTERIARKGYTRPTEIQDKGIAHILEGRDLIGIAGTGTGKTAAFLLPVIQKILETGTFNKALIIAPTRELAQQIQEEFHGLTKGLNLFSTCLIGGSSMGQAMKSLKRKNHVIIGTPGRITDMVTRKLLNLTEFEILILDEFDRMLDMGFSEDVMRLNDKMINKSQTLLFSATLDETQRKLIDQITIDPISITAKASVQDNSHIQQEVVQVEKGKRKSDFLIEVLYDHLEEKAILFCETKRLVNELTKELRQADIRAEMINGDMTQRSREISLKNFRNGKVRVLVATDVVARGIDVSDVTLVVNYQVPRNFNDYIHRIGRTGRAGKYGKAITLID